MYVRCPYCETIFQANEMQLSAQQGLVCCGVCNRVFNGTWNLLDRLRGVTEEYCAPAEPSPDARPAMSESATEPVLTAQHGAAIIDGDGSDCIVASDLGKVELEADGNQDVDDDLSVNNLPASDLKGHPSTTPAQQDVTTDGVVEPAQASGSTRLPADSQLSDTPAPSPSMAKPNRVGTVQATAIPAFYSTLRARDPAIRIAVVPGYSRRSVWLWLLIFLGFGFLFLWQLNHFFFASLAQDQRLRPWLLRACEVVGCQLPIRSNPVLLVLFNTRILSHPAEPSAVRVVSELQNHADFSQTAPLLQLSLSDPRGVVVARRTFSPTAYLVSGQAPLIAAGGSRQIVLDLANPGKSAVGFELKMVATSRSSP